MVLADVYYTDDGKYAIADADADADADSGETLLLRTGRGRLGALDAACFTRVCSAPGTERTSPENRCSTRPGGR